VVVGGLGGLLEEDAFLGEVVVVADDSIQHFLSNGLKLWGATQVFGVDP